MRDKFLNGLIDGAMKGNSDDLNSLGKELSKRPESDLKELNLNGFSFIHFFLNNRLDDILNLAVAHPSLQIALNDAMEGAVDDFAMQEELLEHFRKQINDPESTASDEVGSNRENDLSTRASRGSFFSPVISSKGSPTSSKGSPRGDLARDWDSESFTSVSGDDGVESFDSCGI